MTSEGIQEGTTPTGLRVVNERIPNFYSVAVGVFFRQGSRDENLETNGASHLIEHMLFKGTSKRSAKQILLDMERLGGIGDAFTSREISGFTIRCLKDSSKPLLELLFEMLSDSTFVQKELRKEKQVVYEEIRSTLEDPQEMAYDLFYQACFEPHSLGYPIVGNQKVLSGMDSKMLLDLYAKDYTLSDSVLVAVGDLSREDILDMLPDKFDLAQGVRKVRSKPSWEKQSTSLVHTRSDLSQVHTFMGTHTVGLDSDERYALALLTTLLGGGMSSRLFFSLREDLGLVYTVSSLLELFENTGLIGFYFVTEKTKLSKVFRAIEREISLLKKNGLKKDELATAKTLTKSSLILNMESLSNRMSRLGKWKLLPQRMKSITETIEAFERVTEDQILEVARLYFDSKPFYTSFVGPVTEQDTNPLTRR